MADSNTRQAKRTPVSLKIKFKSATLAQFIERYSVDVSHGGIFIRTKDPLPVGTTMRFEFQLKDASPLITGEGTVVWTREHDPSRTGVAPGMGVRFDRLTEGSQEVLDRILAQKSGKAAERDSSRGFTDMPTRVAPRPLVDGLASRMDAAGGFDDERSDTTPLPSPVPFHSDVDEFPEETFEEATKVRSLAELVAASATGDAAAIQSALSKSVQQAEDDDRQETAHTTRADEDHQERATTTPFGSGSASSSGSFDITLDEDAVPTMAVVPKAPAAAPAASEAPEQHDTEQQDTTPASDTAATAADTTSTAADTTDADTTDAAPARITPARARRAAVAVEHEPESTAPVKSTPSRTREPAESSNTGIAVALVAVLILVLGGGYFLFTRSKATSKVATTEQTDAASVEERPDAAPEQATVVPDEPEPPPVKLVEIEVRSTPSGATATLVGTDQSGPTPTKFQVDESKTHTVRIAQPGFVAQELTIDPGQPAPEPVELAVAPMIIRVTSPPGGAYVYVDGRRVQGETPNEFTLPEYWRKKRRFKVAVRKIGFQKLDVVVEPDQFQDEGNAMVVTVDQPMTEKQRAVQPGNQGGGSGSGSGSGSSATGGGSGDSGSAGSDSGSAGSGSGSGDSGSGSGSGSTQGTGSDAKKDTGGTSSGTEAGTGGGTAEPTPAWAK